MLNNLLADVQPKTNSMSVHLLGAGELAKHLEQLALVSFLDADPCVLDLENNFVPVTLLEQFLYLLAVFLFNRIFSAAETFF